MISVAACVLMTVVQRLILMLFLRFCFFFSDKSEGIIWNNLGENSGNVAGREHWTFVIWIITRAQHDRRASHSDHFIPCFFSSIEIVLLFFMVCVFMHVYVCTAIMLNKLTTCKVCVKAECVKKVYSHINITCKHYFSFILRYGHNSVS